MHRPHAVSTVHRVNAVIINAVSARLLTLAITLTLIIILIVILTQVMGYEAFNRLSLVVQLNSTHDPVRSFSC